MSEVKALDTDIEAHLANWRAYTASKAVGEEQNTALKSAWDTNIGNLSDADGVNSKQSAQDYAKVLSQSEYNAASMLSLLKLKVIMIMVLLLLHVRQHSTVNLPKRHRTL